MISFVEYTSIGGTGSGYARESSDKTVEPIKT